MVYPVSASFQNPTTDICVITIQVSLHCLITLNLSLGAYGVVTMPYGCREGINVFLGGFIPTENMRFRDVALTFNIAEHDAQSILVAQKHAQYKYPRMQKRMIS